MNRSSLVDPHPEPPFSQHEYLPECGYPEPVPFPEHEYPPECGYPEPVPFPEPSPEELAMYESEGDYADRVTFSVSAQNILHRHWWSLGDAAAHVASTLGSNTFEGLSVLEDAIRSGKLKSYGSIDAGPVIEIPKFGWAEYQLIPCDLRAANGDLFFNVIARSYRPYRAEALRDHSFRSNETVPSALHSKGEIGYFRIIANAFVEKESVCKLFPMTQAKPKGRGPSDDQKRLGKTLPLIRINGRSVYPDRRNISSIRIAQRVAEVWYEEDTEAGKKPIVKSLDALRKAVERFYDKNLDK